MTGLPANAQICEIDGAFYEAQLWTVPRVGELIDLYSMVELHDNRPPVRHYRVVQIVHKVRDVTEKTDPPSRGVHCVIIWVEPAVSDFFGA